MNQIAVIGNVHMSIHKKQVLAWKFVDILYETMYHKQHTFSLFHGACASGDECSGFFVFLYLAFALVIVRIS